MYVNVTKKDQYVIKVRVKKNIFIYNIYIVCKALARFENKAKTFKNVSSAELSRTCA